MLRVANMRIFELNIYLFIYINIYSLHLYIQQLLYLKEICFYRQEDLRLDSIVIKMEQSYCKRDAPKKRHVIIGKMIR